MAVKTPLVCAPSRVSEGDGASVPGPRSTRSLCPPARGPLECRAPWLREGGAFRVARMPPTSLQPAWVQATVPGDSLWWGVDPAMTSVERSLLWETASGARRVPASCPQVLRGQLSGCGKPCGCGGRVCLPGVAPEPCPQCPGAGLPSLRPAGGSRVPVGEPLLTPCCPHSSTGCWREGRGPRAPHLAPRQAGHMDGGHGAEPTPGPGSRPGARAWPPLPWDGPGRAGPRPPGPPRRGTDVSSLATERARWWVIPGRKVL